MVKKISLRDMKCRPYGGKQLQKIPEEDPDVSRDALGG